MERGCLGGGSTQRLQPRQELCGELKKLLSMNENSSRGLCGGMRSEKTAVETGAPAISLKVHPHTLRFPPTQPHSLSLSSAHHNLSLLLSAQLQTPLPSPFPSTLPLSRSTPAVSPHGRGRLAHDPPPQLRAYSTPPIVVALAWATWQAHPCALCSPRSARSARLGAGFAPTTGAVRGEVQGHSTGRRARPQLEEKSKGTA